MELKASKAKWVNSILNIIGVNSLRLEGFHLKKTYFKSWMSMNALMVISWWYILYPLDESYHNEIRYVFTYYFIAKLKIRCRIIGLSLILYGLINIGLTYIPFISIYLLLFYVLFLLYLSSLKHRYLVRCIVHCKNKFFKKKNKINNLSVY